MTQGFQRRKWVTQDPVAQTWVNEIVWKVLGSISPVKKLKPITPSVFPGSGAAEAHQLLTQVLVANELQGFALEVYGDSLKDILGKDFFATVEEDKRRTEIFMTELNWILSPRFGPRVVAIGGAGVRRFYANLGQGPLNNPRLVRSLTLWTPTLTTRDEVATVLTDAGYVEVNDKQEENCYIYRKDTQGIIHTVRLRGVLWETTKNWTSDIERAIWDRASASLTSGRMELDVTDQYVLCSRHLSIDHLMGSAVDLLDLITLLEYAEAGFDWPRVQGLKNMFIKPAWIWATLYAISIFEQKTGRVQLLPPWAREAISALHESFWPTFVASRMSWTNPDTRLADFTRAFVKLSKGT